MPNVYNWSLVKYSYWCCYCVGMSIKFNFYDSFIKTKHQLISFKSLCYIILCFRPTWSFCRKPKLSKIIYFLKRAWFCYDLSKYHDTIKILLLIFSSREVTNIPSTVVTSLYTMFHVYDVQFITNSEQSACYYDILYRDRKPSTLGMQ
jgi:hypothetical protein